MVTGREVWRAYSTGPDADVRIGASFKPFYAKDQGRDLVVSTWPGSLWKQGGSTSWAWLTYDPDTKLLFQGTGWLAGGLAGGACRKPGAVHVCKLP